MNHPAFAVLLQAAPAADLPLILKRLPEEGRHSLLKHPRADPALVDWAVRAGSTTDRLALLSNHQLQPELLDRLLELNENRLTAAVYQHPNLTAAKRRRICGRDEMPSSVRDLLLSTRSRHLLAPALAATDLTVALHAHRHVLGLNRSLPANRPEALHAWMLQSPDADDRHLRSRTALFRLEHWTTKDWFDLAALHRDQPLSDRPRRAIIESRQCPRPIALMFIDGRSPETARAALGQGLLEPGHLLRSVNAPHALAALASVRSTHEPTELRAALHRKIGNDPARWNALLRLLPGFPGSVTALLNAAATLPPAPAQPHEDHQAFTFLFGLAAPDNAGEIVAALDFRNTKLLPVADGEWTTPSVAGAVLNAIDLTADQKLILADNSDLPPELYDPLLRFDDPELNAALVTGGCLPPSVARRVVAGEPFGSEATKRLPITRWLRSVLLSAVSYGSEVKHLAAYAADPDVLITALVDARGVMSGSDRITAAASLIRIGRDDVLDDLIANSQIKDVEVSLTVSDALALTTGDPEHFLNTRARQAREREHPAAEPAQPAPPAEDHVKEVLHLSPATWATLAQLLPDFPGTLPELLATARAINE